MSLDLDISDKTTAGTDIIMDAFFGLQQAFAEEKTDNQITQQMVADRLGLKNKSVVNRWLSGRENMTLRAIGELAWALNRRARIVFERSVSEFANDHLLRGHEEELVAVEINSTGVKQKGYVSVAAVAVQGHD